MAAGGVSDNSDNETQFLATKVLPMEGSNSLKTISLSPQIIQGLIGFLTFISQKPNTNGRTR